MNTDCKDGIKINPKTCIIKEEQSKISENGQKSRISRLKNLVNIEFQNS